MFVPSRVARALEEKREQFRAASSRAAHLREIYDAALRRLAGMRSSQLEESFGGVAWPGARPTPELDARGPIVPFTTTWETAQAARGWALERLRGVTTVAVDGSQIAASKEFGAPVSLVQVAWFQNDHDPERPYVKDVVDEIVTADPGAGDGEEYASAESRVSRRRFELEMQVASERVRSLPPDPPPVVLVDGTFALSFMRRMPEEVRNTYLRALFTLLNASRQYRVPVVGYVDLSFAADLVTMLRTAFDLPGGALTDAQILAPALAPFDRTAAFRCARSDVMPLYRTPDRDYGRELCFLYLQTGADRLPVRLDFPAWLLEEGALDRVLDTIRAEIVVGSGYPYALETADATAVLTTEDRMAFFRLFQEFADSAGLSLPRQGKSLSKAHRR
jgi:hypothetical protein